MSAIQNKRSESNRIKQQVGATVGLFDGKATGQKLDLTATCVKLKTISDESVMG